MFSFEKIVECPICKSRDFSRAFQRTYLGYRFTWVLCQNCRLTFQNPRPTEKSLETLFNSTNYWDGKRLSAEGERAAYWDYLSEEKVHLKQAKRRVQWVSELKGTPSEVLDIACAAGSFLKCMTEKGYTGEGIEISSSMGEWGRKHYNLQIRTESFLHSKLESKRYDIVSCWGAISNFYDPRTVLEKIHYALKDDGLFVLSFFAFQHPMRLFRGRRFMKVPSQLYNYSESSLEMLLAESGFSVLRMTSERQYASFEKILHLFNIPPRFMQPLLRQTFRIPSFGGKLLAARKK